jgi:hypothetical protein
VTVGRAFGGEEAFGLFSSFERIHRGSMLFAYLLETRTGAILKADTCLNADPSEKGNISYSLGTTLAELYSEFALATPRLCGVTSRSSRDVRGRPAAELDMATLFEVSEQSHRTGPSWDQIQHRPHAWLQELRISRHHHRWDRTASAYLQGTGPIPIQRPNCSYCLECSTRHVIDLSPHV